MHKIMIKVSLMIDEMKLWEFSLQRKTKILRNSQPENIFFPEFIFMSWVL